jgi:hypothetical protein
VGLRGAMLLGMRRRDIEMQVAKTQEHVKSVWFGHHVEKISWPTAIPSHHSVPWNAYSAL